MGYISEFLRTLNTYDLPNWLIAFAWPILIYYWHDRTKNGISGLEVIVSDGSDSFRMSGQVCPALKFRFINKTGSVVYITNPRLIISSKDVFIHDKSDRDISDNSYELKFMNTHSSALDLRQVILQTNEEGVSFIPLLQPPSQALLTYTTPSLRRLLGSARFFRLEYTVVVGHSRHFVSTTY